MVVKLGDHLGWSRGGEGSPWRSKGGLGRKEIFQIQGSVE